jgi:hypothetical protein
MKWVTRECPKIDRIACPWLVVRFIDDDPEFLFVPSSKVLAVARETGAIPYDVPGVELSHEGELCSFDAFLKKYDLRDGCLHAESPGLLAFSLGLSALFKDDHAMLKHGLLMYDALYAWLKEARGECHGWPPAA